MPRQRSRNRRKQFPPDTFEDRKQMLPMDVPVQERVPYDVPVQEKFYMDETLRVKRPKRQFEN